MGSVVEALYTRREGKKQRRAAESQASTQKALERGRQRSMARSSSDEAVRRRSSRASNILARRSNSASETLASTLG